MPQLGAILAVDPGSLKCGVAMVGPGGVVLERHVVATAKMRDAVQQAVQRHPVSHVVLGDSTSSGAMRQHLQEWLPALAIETVEERGSTLAARQLYWDAHPPRGWRRLLPLALQVPPEPVDDFAAVVLALRYISGCRQA